MILGKSVKYIRRTPVTTSLFIVLFTAAAFFACAGSAVWARSQAAAKAYEDMFVTIGTVRQRATSMEITERWDAAIKDYTHKTAARYASIVAPSALIFDEADYILAPEKRPYYGAWRPDLRLWPVENPNWSLLETFVVEATPLEDCIPEGPVEIQIERVLSESPANVSVLENLKEGDVVWLCDHYNDDPQPIYAGKTYLMYLGSNGSHDPRVINSPAEWNPQPVNFSSQRLPDGARVEININTPVIVEVNDGFYETDPGKLWLEFAAAIHTQFFTLPVLPTGGTNLLLPFHNKTAYIVSGEDITPEEYKNGDYFCLISEEFAEMNSLSPGDKLRLPLYYSDYENAPNDKFTDFDFSGGNGTIVTSTSFQIPNGSIETFMEKWLLLENDELELTFHDRGYTQLQRGLENMKRVSVLLMAIGAAMSLALVFFFCHVFISKNKMRAAIERVLGYTKKQCAVSLLSGFLFIAALSVAIGCAAGIIAEGRITDSLTRQEYYDTSYTIGPLGDEGAELDENAEIAPFAPVAGLLLFFVTCGVSAVFTYRNVREEPLKLLGKGMDA